MATLKISDYFIGNSLNVKVAPINRMVDLFKTLSHPIKVDIIKIIEREKRINVTDLYKTLNMEQAHVSQFLNSMKRVGVLKSEKEGRHTFYSIDIELIEAAAWFSVNLKKY